MASRRSMLSAPSCGLRELYWPNRCGAVAQSPLNETFPCSFPCSALPSGWPAGPRSRRIRSESPPPINRRLPLRSTPSPAHGLRDGWRRVARKCSPATASSPRAIRLRRRQGSRCCGKVAMPLTRRSRQAPCSTSLHKTILASAEISSRWCGRRATKSCTR